jgi:hypothetical protein
MKTLLLSVFLLSASFVNAQTDSLTDQSFNRAYDKSCALVTNGMWNAATGSQPIGIHWRRVASEFDLSHEGKRTYLLAQKQGRTGLGLALAGAGTYLSSVVFMVTGLRNSLVTNSDFNTQIGIGTGLLVSSIALSSTAVSYNRNTYNNFEKALWLRNRDAILTDLPTTAQSQFKQAYEQEAIYLYDRSIWLPYQYIKNGQVHRLDFLGSAGQSVFQGSIQGLDSYQKYQRSKLSGTVLYTLGLVAMYSSTRFQNAGNAQGWTISYIGGVTVAAIGGGIIAKSYSHLRRAIYFRNRDVVRQRLMFQ